MKYLARYNYVLEVEVDATDRDHAADLAAEVDLYANTYSVAGIISTDVQYIELESITELV